MSRIIRFTLAAALIAAASAPSARAAYAQRGTTSDDSRVRVALVASLPVETASAMVVRTDNQPPLVVLTTDHADPVTLGMALSLVRKLRAVPVPPGQQQIVPIQGGVAKTSTSAARTAYLRAQLRRLQERPAGRIGALGTGRYIELMDERPSTRLGSA